MRPTFSIIVFTVLSGTGYGAWFLLGLGSAVGPLCARPGTLDGISLQLCAEPFGSTLGLLAGCVLVAGGLLASLGHLGKPARAWRALSQWRTSWLSREGVAALLTFIPALLLLVPALALEFTLLGTSADSVAPRWWMAPFWPQPLRSSIGLALAAGALATLWSTAHIYASLKPVRAWRDRQVVPGFLLLGLYGGALLLLAMDALDGMLIERDRTALLLGVVALAGLGAWLKWRYWQAIDTLPALGAGRATGLEALGRVAATEAPHSEENYLTHEMGFVLARKHAARLRRITLMAGFAMPALLAAAALAWPALRPSLVWTALLLATIGLLVERWLFFAQARHAVMAYYGR